MAVALAPQLLVAEIPVPQLVAVVPQLVVAAAPQLLVAAAPQLLVAAAPQVAVVPQLVLAAAAAPQLQKAAAPQLVAVVPQPVAVVPQLVLAAAAAPQLQEAAAPQLVAVVPQLVAVVSQLVPEVPQLWLEVKPRPVQLRLLPRAMKQKVPLPRTALNPWSQAPARSAHHVHHGALWLSGNSSISCSSMSRSLALHSSVNFCKAASSRHQWLGNGAMAVSFGMMFAA